MGKEASENRKYFTAEELNIPGYSIIEVGKGKAVSENFRQQADFEFDPDHLADVIEKHGKVYAYAAQKRIKALYVEEKQDNELVCNERYLAADIEGTETAEKMDKQVAYLVANRANNMKGSVAVFMEKTMPKLKVTSGRFNILMALAFSAMYVPTFSYVFHNTSMGICMGICMGIPMGFAFAGHKYYYE